MESQATDARVGWAPVVAWGAWLVGALFVTGILVLASAPGSEVLGEAALFVVVFLGSIAIYPTVGAAIASRRPDHYSGWTLLGFGVALGFLILCTAYTVSGYAVRPGWPDAAHTAWLAGWAFEPLIGGTVIVFLLLFPDGRLVGPRWRVVLVLSMVAVAANAVGTALDPASVSADYPDLDNPFAASASWTPVARTLANLGNVGILVGLAAAAASLVVRYRRADVTERLQIKWVAYVGVALGVVFPIAAAQVGPVSDIAFMLGFTLVAALPLAVAFAILRYRLYDIDRLISRTFVYGSLTALLAGLYAASLRFFQGLFVAFTGNESDAALVLTTLVLATTLTPLKTRLEGFASGHLGEHTPASTTDASGPSAVRVGADAEHAHPLSLADPSDVAALEALVARVVRREMEHDRSGVGDGQRGTLRPGP